MKAYHTYSAVDVAFCLLKHAALQGKRFTNLQLQKLTYVCHGWSLAIYKRPLIIEDVYAWQYGPVVPSVYFQFKRFGSKVIDDQKQVQLDAESEQIIQDIVSVLGDYSGPQLVELTHRQGSPWTQVWDGTSNTMIPDSIIEHHYSQIKSSGHTSCL
jgi:uncharacterized phage-associated protein